MIKLLHMITDTNVGGAGRLLLNQLKRINLSSFDVAVALPAESRLRPCVEALGVRTIPLRYGADHSLDVRALGEAVSLLRREGPDIVHTHAHAVGRLAALLCGVKGRFYTRHCVFPLRPYQKNALYRLGYRVLTGRLSTDVIAVAQAAKENLYELGIPRDRVTVVINGVEPLNALDEASKVALRARYGLAPQEFVIGIFARLVPCKGHETLFCALARCLHEGVDCHLLVVGEGEYRGELEAYAHHLGISDRVIFTGFADDVTELMNVADLVVNASSGTETSSLALSEAMSLGIPCVVTDYGGNPFMVRDGYNGLVVPVGDSESMATAIERLHRDKVLYHQCRQGAYKHYRAHLTAEQMTRTMEELYRKSLI